MKKIIKIIILIVLISILIYVVYQKYIEEKEVISIFDKSFLIVMSGSMEPAISPKELIIIDKQNKYEKGDIVTYSDHENYIVTHRIVEINNTEFISKGDSNNINDKVQSLDKIHGKVIFHSKFCGIFILYMLKPITIIYLLYIIVLEIYCRSKESKNEEIAK